MKATKLTYLLVIALAITMVGTGCRKSTVGVTPIKNRDQIVRPGDWPTGQPPINLNDDITGKNNLSTPMNPAGWMTDPSQRTEDFGALAAHIVHFDYDSSVVKGGEKANVEAVASYMQANADVGLRIDGHCDERGTEDYNNSLGERRATALRDAVLALGVGADRVITQTFGENKPVATGQDESAYRQNRRGEFVVLHKK